MISTITSKGQITLPRQIRDILHLSSGDKVDFYVRDDGHVELVPIKRSIRDMKAMIPPPVRGVTLEDMNAAISAGAVGDDGN